MTKLYLNAEYPDPRTGQGNIAGTHVWLRASVKRGTRPQAPTVVWLAERPAAGNDDLFIVDPTFAVPGGQGNLDTWWAEVVLPPVTGLTWRFQARRSKVGKPDKTLSIATGVETWKRHFIDVEADDAGLYRMFARGLRRVKSAFAEANIEVIENRVEIGGEPVRGKTTDKSVKHGRRMGDLFTVQVHHPQLDRVSPTLHVVIDAGEPSCAPPAAMQGNDLVLTLSPKATFDQNTWVTQLSARPQGGQDLVHIAHWGADGGLGPHALQALRAATVRTAANIVTVKLDHASLQNTWNAQAQAWNTPRNPTLLQALAAGPVEIDVRLAYDIVGATGGQNILGQAGVSTYIDDDDKHLAAVVCHELAHANGLVRQTSRQRYNGGQHRFDSAAAPRVQLNVPVNNNYYYDATFGGSGTHCSLGAQQVASCITNTRLTYVHQQGQQLCLMFHASPMGPNGLLSDGVRFCPSCIRQLRGL
jgi:hypothetical protein